jgi:RNA polymerase-binding transcription factor DksA
MKKNYFQKLRSRKIEVRRTLRHLENERRTVEGNTEWADQAAFEARLNFLDRLADSFLDEIERIDDALSRRDPRRYGLCLACHESIEVERLQVSAYTEFCLDCQPPAKGAQPPNGFNLWRSFRAA